MLDSKLDLFTLL